MTAQAEAHCKKWKWEDYKPGETITEAGVRVTSEPIKCGPEMRNTHYDVLYTCCDTTARMSHEKIRERARKKSTRCRACGYKRTAEVRKLARMEADAYRWAREQAGLPPASEPFNLPASARQRPPPPNYGVVMPTWPVPGYVVRGRTLDCDTGAQPETGADWMACFSPAMAAILREEYSTTHRGLHDAQHEEP